MVAPERTRRRIEDAREAIIATTWELLDDRTWTDLTVADICRAADVAPRTFHRWFPEKAELLFAHTSLHETSLAASLARHVPRDVADVRAGLRAVLADSIALVEPYGAAEFGKRLATIASADELVARDLLKRSRLTEMVAAALEPHLPEPGAHAVAGALLAAMQSALVAWAAGGGPLADCVDRALAALAVVAPA